MRVLKPQKIEIYLDTKDWRILQQVVRNRRQPLSQIAKKTMLSRQSVEYRLKLLQDRGLLTGSRAVVNIRKLGYQSYHFFLEVHTPGEEKKILARALEADFVNAIITYSGKYNLEISIQATNEKEFLKYYERLVTGIRIRNDYLLILLDTFVSQVLPARYFPLLARQNTIESFSPTPIPKVKLSLDGIDLRILLALSRDATRTNTSLAKEMHLSKDTIKYRIGQLEKHQYLQGYRPVVNFAALGLTINTLLLKINLGERNSKELEQYLSSHGSILWATRVFGYYNYLIYVVTQNLEEFHEVINGVKERFDDVIKTYEILFAFEELKYNFMAQSLIKTNSSSASE